MAQTQTFHLEHLPTSCAVHISLFRNVANASFLHQQLLASNTDFDYAFIDASVIISRLHALSAAFRGVNELINNRLRSRNIHAEIVLSLSPNNNIAESFRRFGISPVTSNLLVIKVDFSGREEAAKQVQDHLKRFVQGEQVEFKDETFVKMTDLGRVRKIYKLGGVRPTGQMNWVSTDDERRELEVLVMGCMALRGAMN